MSQGDPLAAARATLETVINASDDIVFCVDARSRALLAFNAAFSDHFARFFDIRVLPNSRIDDLFTNEEYRRLWNGFFDRALAEGRFRTDYETYRGARRIELTFDILRGEDEAIFGISVVGKDVSERERAAQAEEVLRQRNRYIETVLEQAPIGFAVHTIDDGVGRFVSARYEEIYGCARGTIVSHQTFFDVVWPRDPELRDEIRSRVVADMTSGDPARMIWENVPVPLESGETRYITAANIPVLDQNLMVSTVQDVTERVRAEQRLRESELRFRQVAESAADFIWEVDAEGLYTYTSPSVERLLGYSPGELVGKLHYYDLFVPDRRAELTAAALEIIAARQPFRAFAKTLTTKQGRLVHIEASGVPLLDDAGRLHGYRGADTDVTDRKRAEELVVAERDYLRQEFASVRPSSGVVGQSPALRAVLVSVDRVAPTESPVLLLGETGTGKGLMAARIHAGSRRRDRVLVTLNCAALPAGLVESELFGYEKGAFTGALQRTAGRFEVANGGTILLDEIGELPLETQPKLLRVLQSGEFERLGSTRTIRVDTRIIAATNRDLERAVAEGRFRADLYYRLSVFPIRVPPLRDRVGDIELLVWHYIERKQAQLGRSVRHVPAEAMRAFRAYSWPGNVRELENVIERALIMSTGSTLAFDPLGFGIRADSPAPASTLEAVERAHIVAVLAACDWKVSGAGNAAERLGLNRTTLQFRMKKLGIARPGEQVVPPAMPSGRERKPGPTHTQRRD